MPEAPTQSNIEATDIGKEAKDTSAFNSEATENILNYLHSLEPNASAIITIRGGIAKEWLKESPVNPTWSPKEEAHTKTLWAMYEACSLAKKQEFLSKADLKKPTYDKRNLAAIEELLETPPQPKPVETPAPAVEPTAQEAQTVATPVVEATPATPRRQTRAEILRDLESNKDPFVEMVRQQAKDLITTGQERKETNPLMQEAIKVSTKTMEELETVTAHFEKFFPETEGNNPIPLLLYKQAKDIHDLAEGLQFIYGKKVPKEVQFEGKKVNVKEELEKRTKNAIGKAVLQGWVEKKEELVELVIPEGVAPATIVPSEQQEMLAWLGKDVAGTARIHEKQQIWTEAIEYGGPDNKTEIVNRGGFLRVKANIKTPDQEDQDYTKEVAGSEENTETLWALLNMAKVEGVGILLHLKPELTVGLPEKLDQYSQQFPDGFTASPQLREAQEKLARDPNNEIQKANFRKELFSEWIGLTVTCPEYMAKNFRVEFATCLTILSDPFQRSEIYNKKMLEEANDFGVSRYGEDGFTKFRTKR